MPNMLSGVIDPVLRVGHHDCVELHSQDLVVSKVRESLTELPMELACGSEPRQYTANDLLGIQIRFYLATRLIQFKYKLPLRYRMQIAGIVLINEIPIPVWLQLFKT